MTREGFVVRHDVVDSGTVGSAQDNRHVLFPHLVSCYGLISKETPRCECQQATEEDFWGKCTAIIRKG